MTFSQLDATPKIPDSTIQPTRTTDGLLGDIRRVLELEGQAILDCAQRLSQNPKASEQFCKAIYCLQKSLEKGGKIVITGVGKSGKIGQKIAATLCSTGSTAVFVHPTEGLHGDLGLIQPCDVVLALSYTGNTDEILRFIPSLKSRKVPLIGIGGNSRSSLAAECEAWIDGEVKSEACPHNLAPTTSTTLTLALGDAIAVSLMQLRKFDLQSFANNHPGGSLGRKMNLRVSDLMHQGEAIPRVTSNSEMEDIIVESTKKKLGAVLVVEGKRLLGIITDGDLRRSLKHKERFFQLKASDVMSTQPIVASPQMLAHDALRLMEDRPSQISILAVVNDQGDWVGILRLHDLVKTF